MGFSWSLALPYFDESTSCVSEVFYMSVCGLCVDFSFPSASFDKLVSLELLRCTLDARQL